MKITVPHALVALAERVDVIFREPRNRDWLEEKLNFWLDSKSKYALLPPHEHGIEYPMEELCSAIAALHDELVPTLRLMPKLDAPLGTPFGRPKLFTYLSRREAIRDDAEADWKIPFENWLEAVVRAMTAEMDVDYTLRQLIGDVGIIEGFKRNASEQRSKMTGRASDNANDLAYHDIAMQHGYQVNKKAAEIATHSEVDRLENICKVSGGEWSSKWLEEQRANYCLAMNVDIQAVNALSVVDFAEWLRPSGVAGEKKVLTQAVKNAWASWKLAEANNPGKLTNRRAYDWLTKQEFDAPLVGYNLPAFDTWSRQLRDARKYHGEQKHQPRAGRATGKSVVKQIEI